MLRLQTGKIMANKPVVGNYDISQLERLVFFYPWYSYARVKLVEKLAAADTGSAAGCGSGS